MYFLTLKGEIQLLPNEMRSSDVNREKVKALKEQTALHSVTCTWLKASCNWLISGEGSRRTEGEDDVHLGTEWLTSRWCSPSALGRKRKDPSLPTKKVINLP